MKRMFYSALLAMLVVAVTGLAITTARLTSVPGVAIPVRK